jgi:hypothetical protein
MYSKSLGMTSCEVKITCFSKNYGKFSYKFAEQGIEKAFLLEVRHPENYGYCKTFMLIS